MSKAPAKKKAHAKQPAERQTPAGRAPRRRMRGVRGPALVLGMVVAIGVHAVVLVALGVGPMGSKATGNAPGLDVLAKGRDVLSRGDLAPGTTVGAGDSLGGLWGDPRASDGLSGGDAVHAIDWDGGDALVTLRVLDGDLSTGRTLPVWLFVYNEPEPEAPLGYAISTNSTQAVVLRGLAAGRYFARIDARGGISSRYVLSVGEAAPPEDEGSVTVAQIPEVEQEVEETPDLPEVQEVAQEEPEQPDEPEDTEIAQAEDPGEPEQAEEVTEADVTEAVEEETLASTEEQAAPTPETPDPVPQETVATEEVAAPTPDPVREITPTPSTPIALPEVAAGGSKAREDDGERVPELRIQFGHGGGSTEQLFAIATAYKMRLIGVDFAGEAVIEIDPRTRRSSSADPGSIKAMFAAGATPRYSTMYQAIDSRDIRGIVSGEWPYTVRRVLVFMPEPLGSGALAEQRNFIRGQGLDPGSVRETIARIAMIDGRYMLQFIDFRTR